jgi:hypothetical protein
MELRAQLHRPRGTLPAVALHDAQLRWLFGNHAGYAALRAELANDFVARKAQWQQAMQRAPAQAP